jgi:hypothetical protein
LPVLIAGARCLQHFGRFQSDEGVELAQRFATRKKNARVAFRCQLTASHAGDCLGCVEIQDLSRIRGSAGRRGSCCCGNHSCRAVQKIPPCHLFESGHRCIISSVFVYDGLRQETLMSEPQTFRTFADFYPFYLGEHRNPMCRRMHFIGTSIAAALIVSAVVTQHWWFLLLALIVGYAFAWAGHVFFEHNRPATFKYPFFSFLGDWRMWWEILSNKQRLRG